MILPQSRDALFITLGFKEGGEQAALEVLSSLSSLTAVSYTHLTLPTKRIV